MAEEKMNEEQTSCEKSQMETSESKFEPGPNAVDITPNKDGGVVKQIEKEGDGEATPSSGDTVSVHYVGTLTDGTKFDSSRDRGELFEFKLGKGNVIKAWDLGVATMKKGEVAVFYCRSEYAYGETGSSPKIPPNATLIFEVELVSWKGDDLSPNSDGGIIRSRIKAGEGYSTPNEGAMVTVHLIGQHNGKVFEERDVTFPIGEGSEFGIIAGIERAIEKFKKGERSIIHLKPQHAFGENGNKDLNIPPNAEVEYDVTLENFEKAKESWELDNKEKLEQARFLKMKGTKYFKDEKYKLASKQYKKMLSFVEDVSDMHDEDETERKQLLLACNLNLALCYLKQNEHLKAQKSCEKALEQDSNNEKGLFRRGLAYMGLNEMELAKGDFQRVLEIDPKNKAASNQIIQCNNKIREFREKERKLYGNMFSKFAKQDTLRELKSAGDVMANPGTWGEDDSYFKDKKSATKGNVELISSQVEGLEKLETFNEAVNSCGHELIP